MTQRSLEGACRTWRSNSGPDLRRHQLAELAVAWQLPASTAVRVVARGDSFGNLSGGQIRLEAR